MTKIKRLGRTTPDENSRFAEDGMKLYLELRQKYASETEYELDYVLNILCSSLVCLAVRNVEKDDRMQLLQTIYRILLRNLEGN